jgi:Rieske Fe-S protein
MTATSTRRQFVLTCGTAAAALALGPAGCASVVATRVTPVNGRVRLPIAEHPALSRPGGSLRVLPDGARDEILVLANPDGGYAVLSSVCTHQGCTVEAQASRLVCPCHGSTYDRTGQVLVGPAERALARFQAELTDDGILEISLGGAS